MSSHADAVQGDKPIFVAYVHQNNAGSLVWFDFHGVLLSRVVGITGAGKSTFINLLSDTKHEVGKGLKLCTIKAVPSEPIFINAHKVVLFDTPGFDDKKGDDVILKEIADLLTAMCV
jgi:predicted GTPase